MSGGHRTPASAPSLLHEAVFAFVASAIASVGATALGLILPAATAGRAVVVGLTLACALRSFSREPVTRGMTVALSALAIGTTLAWWLAPTVPLFVAAEAAMLWLVRCTAGKVSPARAGIDLGAIAAAVSFGAWTALHTGSVFLTCWSALLTLALADCIACRPRGRRRPGAVTPPTGFAAAKRGAEAALERLQSTRPNIH